MNDQLPSRENPLTLTASPPAPQPTTTTALSGTASGAPSDTLPQTVPLYDQVGGHEFFVRLVDAFYEGVAKDEPLRALYPEEDLGPAAERLVMFLEQYWGGPHTYHERRGHPRLRMRHAPFAVTPTQRDRWLAHMGAALEAQDLPQPLHDQMWAYFSYAANFLVNESES